MDVPVVLFIFKRQDTVLKIIDRIRVIQPKKVYIISDQGRSPDEVALVEYVRDVVEKAIDWDCLIIRDYADRNRGVYENIGLGAMRVFEDEDKAIFLEDDNLPEVSFFKYCEELLQLYENNEKVLWICGTNYYDDINKQCKCNYNYYFTQHMLPCGWASWSKKFRKLYDKDLKLLDDKKAMKEFRKSYENQSLYRQQLGYILEEKFRRDANRKYISWDYHMLLSIRAQNLYGIVPAQNQITNIGADSNSTHGGTSMDFVMTSRFCHVPSKPFKFPIQHHKIEKNYKVEWLIEKKVLYPTLLRIRVSLNRTIKKMLRIDPDMSLRMFFSAGHFNG